MLSLIELQNKKVEAKRKNTKKMRWMLILNWYLTIINN